MSICSLSQGLVVKTLTPAAHKLGFDEPYREVLKTGVSKQIRSSSTRPDAKVMQTLHLCSACCSHSSSFSPHKNRLIVSIHVS